MSTESETWSSHSRAQMLPKERRTAAKPPAEEVKVVQESVDKAKEDEEEPQVAKPEPEPSRAEVHVELVCWWGGCGRVHA